MSVYGVCFILCAVMNHDLARHNKYDPQIPFLMDSGNPYAHHVQGAHAALQEEPWLFLNTGTLTFGDDNAHNLLQAADVIAWASRARTIQPFSKGYEPLDGIFNEAHVQQDYPPEAIAQMAVGLAKLRRDGLLAL
jgi:hypothetical protein